MTLETGYRLARYEIVEALGAGGMGEVYRARDPGLEREVALKVLPSDTLGDDTAQARMVREARMAAKLNHPHVCTVHEVGEADGQVYIAMELVEGQPLDAILAGGGLSIDHAVRYGVQIADALAHAHERGVVHRDLKSANVVITPEGRTKVLDFGLAKQLVGEELAEATTEYGATLTVPGSVVGTVAYMAPEQLRGQAADARSDVWALGVVLYEMLGGRRPFAGQTGYELSSAILNESPPPLHEDVPDAVWAVVERCLAKAPDERFQTAEQVRGALETAQTGGVVAFRGPRFTAEQRRWWLAGATMVAILALLAVLDVGGVRQLVLGRGGQPQAVRMAVLPFVNLTGDPEQEYLSDGITQEMITQLGRLHPESLSVIARSSVMRYKGGATPIDQIGRELGVQYVLEGSARREADRVRITAELIEVADQTQLWADSYERELAGILAVQSEVAQQVAEALALKLLPAEQARVTSVQTVNPEAYDAYLKGSYHWQKLTRQDLDTAQRYFDLALEKDPEYAPAYEGLAIVWGASAQMGFVPPSEAGPKSMEAALKAIELDPNSAKAHEAMALARTWREWDWTGGADSFQRTLELNPNGANAHASYAHFLAITGHIDEAIPHSERAIELDPLNATYYAFYAWPLIGKHRYDDALEAARAALEIQPDNPVAASALSLAAARTDDFKEAVAAAKTAMKTQYDDQSVEDALEEGWAQGGYPEAMRRCAVALEERFQASFALPSDIAIFWIEAGEHEKALEWLERGFEIHDPGMPYISFLPYYDSVRFDPRFQDLLRRMNLPTE